MTEIASFILEIAYSFPSKARLLIVSFSEERDGIGLSDGILAMSLDFELTQHRYRTETCFGLAVYFLD